MFNKIQQCYNILGGNLWRPNRKHSGSRSKIEKIHELDYLTRILINQYSDLKQLFPKEPTSEIRTKTKDFMKLVYRLATKSPEEDIDPIFPGRHISVALVLVGRSENSKQWVSNHT